MLAVLNSGGAINVLIDVLIILVTDSKLSKGDLPVWGPVRMIC